MKEYSKMVGTNPPPRAHARGGGFVPAISEYSDMKGTQHIGTRDVDSQPHGKLFGSVYLMREVLSGTFPSLATILFVLW